MKSRKNFTSLSATAVANQFCGCNVAAKVGGTVIE